MNNLIILSISFLIGFGFAYSYKQSQFNAYKLEIEQQSSMLIAQALDRANKIELEKDKIASGAQNEINSINAKYNALLNKYNSLHSGKNSGEQETNCDSTRAHAINKNQCVGANRQGVDEIITVAKECDLLNERYSRLQSIIRLYFK